MWEIVNVFLYQCSEFYWVISKLQTTIFYNFTSWILIEPICNHSVGGPKSWHQVRWWLVDGALHSLAVGWRVRHSGLLRAAASPRLAWQRHLCLLLVQRHERRRRNTVSNYCYWWRVVRILNLVGPFSVAKHGDGCCVVCTQRSFCLVI